MTCWFSSGVWVAPYLFADECTPVSPRLTLLMYRYPSEPFDKEQKHHMLTWLGGEHMILSVLFTDWSFKLWTLSFAALCLHLEMSHLVAVFLSRVDFFKKANKKLCADLDLRSNLSAFFLICLLPLSLFYYQWQHPFFFLLYFHIYAVTENITKHSLLYHCKCSVEATWLLCWLTVKPEC